jgi:hypothetical protein
MTGNRLWREKGQHTPRSAKRDRIADCGSDAISLLIHQAFAVSTARLRSRGVSQAKVEGYLHVVMVSRAVEGHR